MEISVVVPTFNRLSTVSRSLELLFAQEAPRGSFEIIVVVDGSTDGTAEALRRLKPDCSFRVIEQENRGLAGARNTGYRAAEGKLVLFLDDDMMCDSRLIEVHLAAHKGENRTVVFGALFLSPDSLQNLAAECFKREIGRIHLESASGCGAKWQETDCVFSNTSVPKKLLEEFGGFDEGFRMREDLELGYRLFKAGVKPKYITNAIAYQFYDKSSADLIRDAERFAKADLLFAQKHPEAEIEGQIAWLKGAGRGKTRLVRLAASYPRLTDAILAPVCGLGEHWFNVLLLRHAAIRALLFRRRVHWLHTILELAPDALKPMA
jgi:GT2 family glycosyltransferase